MGQVFMRFRKIAISDCLIRHVRPSALHNSAYTGRIFKKFDIWASLKNLLKN
jgi:hypothetical protein